MAGPRLNEGQRPSGPQPRMVQYGSGRVIGVGRGRDAIRERSPRATARPRRRTGPPGAGFREKDRAGLRCACAGSGSRRLPETPGPVGRSAPASAASGAFGAVELPSRGAGPDGRLSLFGPRQRIGRTTPVHRATGGCAVRPLSCHDCTSCMSAGAGRAASGAGAEGSSRAMSRTGCRGRWRGRWRAGAPVCNAIACRRSVRIRARAGCWMASAGSLGQDPPSMAAIVELSCRNMRHIRVFPPISRQFVRCDRMTLGKSATDATFGIG